MGWFLSFSGLSWEPLGASWGDLGSSWGEIGWSRGDFWGTSIFDNFWERFWGQKGCPKGGILGAQTEQNSIKKTRCKFKGEKVASWSRLGAILGRFPRRLGVKNVDFSLVFKGFREHQRF